LKVAIAQLNPIVGDIQGNSSKITDALSRLDRDPPDLLVFPELFLVGYPPKDLLERPGFIERVQAAIQQLAQASAGYPQTGILFGAPLPTGKDTGKGLHNSAILVYRGQVLFTQHKSLLPTYDVFDEARYFDPVLEVDTVPFRGEVLGISICEDAWTTPEFWPRRMPYDIDPVQALADKGATLLVNISASPFCRGKERIRYQLIRTHARRHALSFVYANQVGANDELIFDGRSLCVDHRGEPIAALPAFAERVETVDAGAPGKPGSYLVQDEIESVYQALLLGLRDYMSKCGFSQAVIGLSGGIDSAVTCCLAAAALGTDNVLALSMPSQFSSPGSVEDARTLAKNLGIRFQIVPISGLSVLADVPKTMVWELAHYINRQGQVIPQQTIAKPPSAELRPNQTDQDTLPPYPILDEIIHRYVEEQYSTDEIIADGFDPDTVRWVVRRIRHSEYKRRQAAPGLKVTSKAFGVGRRMPIAAKFEC